jgi:hypothetical protein
MLMLMLMLMPICCERKTLLNGWLILTDKFRRRLKLTLRSPLHLCAGEHISLISSVHVQLKSLGLVTCLYV